MQATSTGNDHAIPTPFPPKSHCIPRKVGHAMEREKVSQREEGLGTEKQHNKQDSCNTGIATPIERPFTLIFHIPAFKCAK